MKFDAEEIQLRGNKRTSSANTTVKGKGRRCKSFTLNSKSCIQVS